MSAATWPATAGGMQDAAPRLFDAAGADDCIDVLINRRCSLLLCSDDGAVLDRQAQMLLRNLRDVADVETAVLLDMDRGLLLERVNRLLSEFTLEQARQRVPVSVRVWILHVQTASELNQARLLLRLCQDFPASGVTLALLGSVAVGRELAPEGSTRRLQVRVLTDFWSEMSRAAGAVGRTDPPLGPVLDDQATTGTPPAAPTPAPQSQPAFRAGASRAPWIGLGLLMACAGAVVWVQSRGGLDLVHGPSPAPVPSSTVAAPGASTAMSAGPGAGDGPVPVPVPPAAAPAEATLGPTAELVTQTPAVATGAPGAASAPAPPAMPTAEPRPVAAVTLATAAPLPAPAAAAGAVVMPAATSDRPDARAGKSLPPAEPAPASRAPPSPSTPTEDIASSVRWVQAQPPSGWLVQHGIDSDVGRLLDLRRNYPRLKDARVLALLRADGRLYYALVSGPFDSAGDARNFIKDGEDIPSLPWVRSIASLSRELDERRGRLPGSTAAN